MSKLMTLVRRAGLAAAAFALAANAFAAWVPSPDTAMTLAPPNYRLTLAGVLTHAKPLIQLILAGLVAAIAYAAVVYIRGVIERRAERTRGLVLLSALAADGPLIGFLCAAYGLLDICIAIANKPPSATLIMLAPASRRAHSTLP